MSGYKVSADDRDKLQLIKKKAEQGKFDILLVFMFDRFERFSSGSPKAFINVLQESCFDF